MTRAVGFAAIEVPIRKFCGRVAFSSSLMSYEMTRWASIVLSVLAAKNRPGLQIHTSYTSMLRQRGRALTMRVYRVRMPGIQG